MRHRSWLALVTTFASGVFLSGAAASQAKTVAAEETSLRFDLSDSLTNFAGLGARPPAASRGVGVSLAANDAASGSPKKQATYTKPEPVIIYGRLKKAPKPTGPARRATYTKPEPVIIYNGVVKKTPTKK